MRHLSLRIASQMPVRRFPSAILMLLVVASCGKGRTQASTVPEDGVVRIEISAPSSVPGGRTVQLIASAHRNDGSVRNVTSQASWTSSNSSVLTISRPGLVSATSPGKSTITVAYRGVQHQVTILVPSDRSDRR
jgi:Bacterial Ig-like domain (group 2)